MYYFSFYVCAAIVLVFSLACLAGWAWAVRGLKRDAQVDYAERETDRPKTIDGVGAAEFVSIYVRSYQPRWALYAAGGATSVLVAAPVALLVISQVYTALWRMGGSVPWAGPTGYVFMFVLFFGTALAASVVAAGFARQFHRNAPEPFNHALARARGEPLPEETTWRRRPKWARRARPDPHPDASET